MLSGACACSVAVVKSLNMGNHTDTHTLSHTVKCQLSVWSSIFSGAQCLFGYLKVFVTVCIQHYSWRATFPERHDQGLDKALDRATTNTHTHTHTHTHTNRNQKKWSMHMHMHLVDQPHFNKVILLNLCSFDLHTNTSAHHLCPTVFSLNKQGEPH